MGLDTTPKTMLEALKPRNEFKVKAPTSMEKPGEPMRKVFAVVVISKGASKRKKAKRGVVNRASL
jgi:hypothetical protein